MKRYASVIELAEEHAAAYRRLHAAVWPAVLARLAASNIRNYSITSSRKCSDFLRNPLESPSLKKPMQVDFAPGPVGDWFHPAHPFRPARPAQKSPRRWTSFPARLVSTSIQNSE